MLFDKSKPFETFDGLKSAHPFRAFDVVTDTGGRVAVRQRFGFGFNRRYVMILDARDLPVRVSYEHIHAIEFADDASVVVSA
jgi:hypothetical protein